MDTTIQDDFNDFINESELFSSIVCLYDKKCGSLVFEGKGIYDEKPLLVENENEAVVYQGHKSILTLSMKELTFMSFYFSLKGYYVEITDNVGLHKYDIVGSSYNSNVNNIFCELKENNV